MCKILIFGGTTEGRQLAEFCAEHRISAYVSSATDYGTGLIKKSGIPYINKEATFRMRAGYTLLRLNKLDEAEKVLKRCIQVHKELGETPCIAQALLYLTEVLLRQNKFDEAYECAQQSLMRMDKASSNNDRFFKATCNYFLSIMELNMHKDVEALSHFNEFLSISDSVCKSMLDAKVYDTMFRKGIFSKVRSMKEMKQWVV